MEPIWGFIFFTAVCCASWIVASKRGNRGVLYFLISAGAGISLVIFVSFATGGRNGFQAGLGGFIGAFTGLALAALMPNDASQAGTPGASSGHKICPHCAEPVKIQAIKCKHCGSQLAANPSL